MRRTDRGQPATIIISHLFPKSFLVLGAVGLVDPFQLRLGPAAQDFDELFVVGAQTAASFLHERCARGAGRAWRVAVINVYQVFVLQHAGNNDRKKTEAENTSIKSLKLLRRKNKIPGRIYHIMNWLCSKTREYQVSIVFRTARRLLRQLTVEKKSAMILIFSSMIVCMYPTVELSMRMIA